MEKSNRIMEEALAVLRQKLFDLEEQNRLALDKRLHAEFEIQQWASITIQHWYHRTTSRHLELKRQFQIQ